MTTTVTAPPSPPPFETPLPWLWSCHHCHARYPLGATRRCLHDGHYFCGGTTVSFLTGKIIKRHKACGSEFDYLGWEDVAHWRNSLLDAKYDINERLKRKRGCEEFCEYPSACHHHGGHLMIRKNSKADTGELLTSSAQATSEPTIATNATVFESFLDPSFFEVESSPSSSSSSSKPSGENKADDILSAFPSPKRTGSIIKKMTKTGKRNAQLGTLFSTTEPEEEAADILRPLETAPARPLSSSPPTLFIPHLPIGAEASAKELGIELPSLDFSPSLPSFFSPDSSSSSSSEAASLSSGPDEEVSPTSSTTTNIDTTPPRKNPHIDLQLDDMDGPPDIDMTDCIPDSPTSPSSPGFPLLFRATPAAKLGGLLTPKSPDSPTNPLFRCELAPKSEEQPPSPLSPRRNAWGWGAGNEEAALAVTPPSANTVKEDVEMELGEMWDVSLLVDDKGSDTGVGIGALDRRDSV